MEIIEEVKQAISFTKEKKFRSAEKIYLSILKKDANNPVVLSALGLLYLNIGNFVKSEKYLEKSYKIKPNIATIEGLAHANYNIGDNEKACFYFEKLFEKNKSYDTYDKYTKCLVNVKSYKKAYEIGLEGHKKYPFAPTLLLNLAWGCIGTGRLEEAVCYGEQLVKGFPKFGEGWTVFGIINETYYHNEDVARECFKKALRNGDKSSGYYNLAVNASKAWDYKHAYYYLKMYKKLFADNPTVNFLNATFKFRERKFKAGYKYYAKKEDMSNKKKLHSKLKRLWDGKTYRDETLLVLCDQGIGDHLMFIRFIPQLQKKFKQIKVIAHKSEIELYRRSFKYCKNIKFYTLSKRFPRYDKSVILSNLPYYLKTDLKDIPNPSGYLYADEGKIAEYKHKYFEHDKLKVGLCWEAGAAGWREQLNRTINISALEPLFDIEGVEFYSFQVNPSLDNYKKYNLIDLGKDFKDFDDTAAALKNVDIMVTVDTSVSNLSGALGVKTFMLLPYCPDWRWFDNEHDTEWYESVRIFRQSENLFWDKVVDNIKHAIMEEMAK
jgi:tetratricopeptide (TPR) repeat protein